MRLQPNRNYRSSDAVMTPRPLARALVTALAPSGSVLEPSAGDGAFVEALRECPAVTSVQTCEIIDGDMGFTWWTEHVNFIVGNPPWSNFRVFLAHAMQVSDNVAFLVTVNHFFTKRRVRDVCDAGFGYKTLLFCEWPMEWPSSGFALGFMHLQRGYRGPCTIRQLGDDAQ